MSTGAAKMNESPRLIPPLRQDASAPAKCPRCGLGLYFPERGCPFCDRLKPSSATPPGSNPVDRGVVSGGLYHRLFIDFSKGLHRPAVEHGPALLACQNKEAEGGSTAPADQLADLEKALAELARLGIKRREYDIQSPYERFPLPFGCQRKPACWCAEDRRKAQARAHYDAENFPERRSSEAEKGKAGK